MYAASALAANTICRSAAGSAAPLFTTYMFDALGVGGGGSLIAGVACLLVPIPFVFYKYGEPIRKRSKFAPTSDKSDANEGKKDEEQSAGSESEDSSDKEDKADELGLDEEMGVPDPVVLAQEIEAERLAKRIREEHLQGGDRFLDASGMERAER
jgi:DHA1 family multidrug resistance protein-like MFS transporter